MVAGPLATQYRAVCARACGLWWSEGFHQVVGSANWSVTEHQGIAEALVNKNPDLARQRLQDHISVGRQRVLDILGLGDFHPAP